MCLWLLRASKKLVIIIWENEDCCKRYKIRDEWNYIDVDSTTIQRIEEQTAPQSFDYDERNKFDDDEKIISINGKFYYEN